MYPDFVKQISSDAEGTRMLEICGKQFLSYSYDWYIDDAIALAAKWRSVEVTYKRIVHLRYWIRENYQHDHNISYKGIRSVKGCYRWIEKVIHAEFKNADEIFKEVYVKELQQNKSIFSNADCR